MTVCSVCFEEIEIYIKPKCGHYFCPECINEWFSRQNSCPNCRKPLTDNDSRFHKEEVPLLNKSFEILYDDGNKDYYQRITIQITRVREDILHANPIAYQIVNGLNGGGWARNAYHTLGNKFDKQIMIRTQMLHRGIILKEVIFIPSKMEDGHCFTIVNTSII
jgi:hypothetical protein